VSDAGEAQKVEGTVPSQWLLDEKMRRQRAEAECGRLREQLDALTKVAKPLANLPYPVSSYERARWLERQQALRAALGVEGEGQKPCK
jgi:hypothetical protein